MIGAILAKRSVPAWFDAMNRHDIDALLKDYADDVVMVYPGDVEGVSGTTTGKLACATGTSATSTSSPSSTSVSGISLSATFSTWLATTSSPWTGKSMSSTAMGL